MRNLEINSINEDWWSAKETNELNTKISEFKKKQIYAD